jgi:hypothetical protein
LLNLSKFVYILFILYLDKFCTNLTPFCRHFQSDFGHPLAYLACCFFRFCKHIRGGDAQISWIQIIYDPLKYLFFDLKYFFYHFVSLLGIESYKRPRDIIPKNFNRKERVVLPTRPTIPPTPGGNCLFLCFCLFLFLPFI